MNKTNQEYLDVLLQHLKRKNLKPKTISGYTFAITSFLEYCERNGKELTDFTTGDMTRYLDLAYKDNKYKTKVRGICFIKSFFNLLCAFSPTIFTSNPVNNVLHSVRINQADVTPTTYLTKRDWNKIISLDMPLSNRVLLLLLYDGGLRLHETIDIKVSDINLDEQFIDLVRKGGKRHKLYLDTASEFWQLIPEYIKGRKGLLFSSRNGTPLYDQQIFRIINKLKTKAKVLTKITPHSFRKACATNLYYKTNDIFRVQKYLNHSSVNTTQIYIEDMPYKKDA
jgi:integrase/recombinase XerD